VLPAGQALHFISINIITARDIKMLCSLVMTVRYELFMRKISRSELGEVRRFGMGFVPFILKVQL
jgi:hypothetical protein